MLVYQRVITLIQLPKKSCSKRRSRASGWGLKYDEVRSIPTSCIFKGTQMKIPIGSVVSTHLYKLYNHFNIYIYIIIIMIMIIIHIHIYIIVVVMWIITPNMQQKFDWNDQPNEKSTNRCKGQAQLGRNRHQLSIWYQFDSICIFMTKGAESWLTYSLIFSERTQNM